MQECRSGTYDPLCIKELVHGFLLLLFFYFGFFPTYDTFYHIYTIFFLNIPETKRIITFKNLLHSADDMFPVIWNR